MADTKISALTENSSPAGTEYLVTSEGGANKKVTTQNVANLYATAANSAAIKYAIVFG